MIMENLKPLTEGQKKLYNALNDTRNSIVGIFGPSGTGKTLFALAYSLDAIMSKKYDRLVLIKPVAKFDSQRTFSSLDLGEVYYSIVKDYLLDMVLLLKLDWSGIESLIVEKRIIIVDPETLHGRSFDRSIIFVDDAHLLSTEAAYEILMRIGNDSRFIIAGDPVLQGSEKSGISILRNVLLGESRATVVDLGLKDIVRHGAKIGIKLLLEAKMRKREMGREEKKVASIIAENIPDLDLVTVLDLRRKKENYPIPLPQVPDFILVVKEGQAGKIIGKGGSKINKIEKLVGGSIRIIETGLNFKDYVKAFHPVGWIAEHIKGIDFRGPYLTVVLDKRNRGPFIGNKGAYIRFFENIVKELIGMRVKVE